MTKGGKCTQGGFGSSKEDCRVVARKTHPESRNMLHRMILRMVPIGCQSDSKRHGHPRRSKCVAWTDLASSLSMSAEKGYTTSRGLVPSVPSEPSRERHVLKAEQGVGK
jgi:hypothetical protein